MVTQYGIPGNVNIGGEFAYDLNDVCAVRKTSAQSISNNTLTAVTFDTDDLDPNDMHSTVSDTENIGIPSGSGGLYLIGAYVIWAADSTGVRYSALYRNAINMVEERRNAINQTEANLWHLEQLDDGDVISFVVYQSSGGALNCDTGTVLWAIRILGV